MNEALLIRYKIEQDPNIAGPHRDSWRAIDRAIGIQMLGHWPSAKALIVMLNALKRRDV